MPYLSYQWHLAKCKSKIAHETKGLPTFYCQYHGLHIFFRKIDVLAHELECENNPANKREVSQAEQYLLYEDVKER